MSMDLVNRIEWIVSMEKKYPIDTYQCDGLDMWPILRYHWHLLFKSPEEYNKAINPVSRPINRNIAIRSMRKITDKKIFRKSITEVGTVKNLVYSRISEYTEKVNGSWMNRYTDPYLFYLKQTGKVIKFETEFSEKSNKSSEPPVIFPFADFKYSFLLHNHNFEHQINEKVELFFNSLPQEVKSEINLSRLINGMIAISYYRKYFSDVFNVLKPQFVFTVDYFSSDGFGLIAAAHDKKVKSIDLQHGKQGNFHTMYTHFTKVPKKGFNTLPNYYFNWGNESVDAIKDNCSTESSHIPVCIGNPWIAGWISGRFIGEYEEQIKSVRNFRKVVLFSLQPVDDTLPDFVVDAINKSASDIIWLMRFHPSMKISIDFFKDRKVDIEKIEFKKASEIPLMELLKITDIHFTSWSSVVFEAALAGIHSVIVHPLGKKLYSNQIREGIFNSANKMENCLDLIEKNSRSELALSDFIIADEKIIQNNITKFIRDVA